MKFINNQTHMDLCHPILLSFIFILNVTKFQGSKIIQTLQIFITIMKINSTQATSTQHVYQKVLEELLQTHCPPL
jgi:uncharacterized integral membrane protein